jgi:hypothetical protein
MIIHGREKALDPYERPPAHLIEVFKYYRKIKECDLVNDINVVDFRNLSLKATQITRIGAVKEESIAHACLTIGDVIKTPDCYEPSALGFNDRPIFQHSLLQGKKTILAYTTNGLFTLRIICLN